jgi:SAM-dependent methyltransferase
MKVTEHAVPDFPSPAERISGITAGYDDWVVRAYVWGRFLILRDRFLDEIGQYLPQRGAILDVGCGFGLFSLYFASLSPERHIVGLDLNHRRIAMAAKAAAHLGLTNVEYAVADAAAFQPGREYQAAYMLDLIHHIPRESARQLLQSVATSLPLGGVLIVKDVDTRPAYKRMFTRALDWAMDPDAAVQYWNASEFQQLLQGMGFRVYRHKMNDVLPYPHMLFICSKTAQPAS